MRPVAGDASANDVLIDSWVDETPDRSSVDVSKEDSTEENAETSTESDSDASDRSLDEIHDAADAPACSRFLYWTLNGDDSGRPCGGMICPPTAPICVPACALGHRSDPLPCGEFTCQADELCTTSYGGVDSGPPHPTSCTPAPAKVCNPGGDCCYTACGLFVSSVTIDFDGRSLACEIE
jgi:hypothetical protein